jgi:hypothetical protein
MSQHDACGARYSKDRGPLWLGFNTPAQGAQPLVYDLTYRRAQQLPVDCRAALLLTSSSRHQV